MQADAGWETAVAVLKTVLNIALDTVASPSVMLRLKDFVLLVCSALGKPQHTFGFTQHISSHIVHPDRNQRLPQ